MAWEGVIIRGDALSHVPDRVQPRNRQKTSLSTGKAAMPFLVTLTAGLIDVALPNGQVAQGEETAILTDDEYAQLSPTSDSLFSSARVAVSGDVSTVSTFAPVITDTNPYTEGYGPGIATDYLDSSYVPQGS